MTDKIIKAKDTPQGGVVQTSDERSVADDAESKNVEKSLKEQLHFLQTLIDTIPNPIFYKDTNGFYLGCNKAFQERLGLPRDRIIGKRVYDLFPRDLADEYYRMDMALMQDPGEQSHETTIYYADGQKRDVIINKGTFTNTDGVPAGLVGVHIDITERKRAQRALQAAHDELEQRVELRTRELAQANSELRNEIVERRRAEDALRRSAELLKLFAYSVIHDLKSPAIGVYGLANLLKKHYGEVLDERAGGYCTQILKAAEHLNSLVQTINAYIASKEAPIRFEDVSMKEIIGEVRNEFSARLSTLKVDWVESGEFPDIRADRLSMMRLFTNLVDNALKYGGAQLSQIRIGCDETDQGYVFSVSDDGVGIGRENTERLFRFFQREDSSQGIEGTGLGLAIVKEIVERHGGTVRVEPGPTKGTTFYFSIPKNPSVNGERA